MDSRRAADREGVVVFLNDSHCSTVPTDSVSVVLWPGEPSSRGDPSQPRLDSGGFECWGKADMTVYFPWIWVASESGPTQRSETILCWDGKGSPA